MSSLVITSTCQSQPAGYRPLDPRLDGVYAGYAGPSGWVNSGPQPGVMPKSAYYDATMTSQGYALNGNTYNQKLDLGTVGSGPTYGLLFVFELDAAPITSATARMNGVFSAPAVSSIGLGSVTSYISGETITIAALTGNGNKRTSITEEVPVGPHVLCIHWNDSSAQYEIWLDGRAPAISTANGGVQLIDLVGSMFHGRGYAGDARPCPALVAVSRTPNVDLREYQGNPWALFAQRRIFVPTTAPSGLPTLSASTYKAGTLTSSGWTPQITAT